MTVAEDWAEEYEDGVCDRCGKHARVISATDPYIAELYPEDDEEESRWCYECFMNRKGDI